MSLSGIMNTALSGLTAQRVAIDVTSENVANINTPGYSAQKPVFETTPTVNVNGLPLGSGVKVAHVQRNYDDMLQTLLKNESSTNGESSVLQTNMASIEQLFPDLTTDGLGKSIQDYFNAWQNLSVNPQGTPERQAVISSGQQVAQNFQQINVYLNNIKTAANQSLEGLTNDINDKLKNIATLNVQIQQAGNAGANANVLLDQRDQLVRDLSKKIGVNYKAESDGSMTVTLSSDPSQTLVSGSKYGAFSVQTNINNQYDIYLTQAGAASSAVINLSGSKGEIGGTLKVRDQIVDDYLSKLDELAYNIATEVNSVHAAGYGLDNSTGNDFFTNPAAVTGYSALISVAVTDPDQLAAADTDVVANGKGNNTNALTIAGLASKPVSSSAGSITMSSFYNALVGSVGVGVQNANRAKDLSDSVLTQLGNLRESQSGVSMDEEMTNLLNYQKAYEGSAKMISAVAEMMDTIINMVR
jgi:flagellar hook-associated protein 1 FlgK